MCCLAADCPDRKPIVIDCDTCRRPVARLVFGGGGVMLSGGISPEGSLRGGGRTGTSPEWRARIWNANPGGFAPARSTGRLPDRVKLVCLGKRDHRKVQIVMRESLVPAYVNARRNGLVRISMSELRHARPGRR